MFAVEQEGLPYVHIIIALIHNHYNLVPNSLNKLILFHTQGKCNELDMTSKCLDDKIWSAQKFEMESVADIEYFAQSFFKETVRNRYITLLANPPKFQG